MSNVDFLSVLVFALITLCVFLFSEVYTLYRVVNSYRSLLKAEKRLYGIYLLNDVNVMRDVAYSKACSDINSEYLIERSNRVLTFLNSEKVV
jgi:hypothetical protein